MRQSTTRHLAVAAWALVGIWILSQSGCSSRAPLKPELSPTESAAKALEEYDEDSSGSISEEEAEKAPGLLAAFGKIDSDGDGEVTADEIEKRIIYYQTSTSWVINGTCKVRYKGRPLEGADVVFEPESFLGESFQPCSGVTDERGEVFITRQADPEAVRGIYLGFYRVRISKAKANGKEMIPAKYNEETTLGFEANNDVPEDAMYSGIPFNLK